MAAFSGGEAPTYAGLYSQARKGVFAYCLKHRLLPPSVFVWAAVTAILTVTVDFFAALAWTVAALLAGYGMTRVSLARPEVLEQLLRVTLQDHRLRKEQWEHGLWSRASIQRGSKILVASALVIEDLESEIGPDSALRSAFREAFIMVSLMYSLSKHVEELERTLRIATADYSPVSQESGIGSEVTMPANSTEQDNSPIAELAANLRARIEEISRQLEMYLSLVQEIRVISVKRVYAEAVRLARDLAEVRARLQASTA